MNLLTIILTALLDIVPSGDATLVQLQKRDSILIADQVRYGVRISRLEADTRLTPLMDAPLSDSLMKVRDWHLDTLRTWQPKEGPAHSDV